MSLRCLLRKCAKNPRLISTKHHSATNFHQVQFHRISSSRNHLHQKSRLLNLIPTIDCLSTARCSSAAATANLVTMKMDTPEYRQIFTPELKELSGLFEKYNYELRIAGGAVRDLLVGKTPHDIDFATTATPTDMKEMFEKENIRMINTKGESHGTITCRINDKENFEVTTLRIDVRTDGRHAEIEFTTDWKLDSLRRDLTINSMFMGLDGTIYDYFNGIQDVENRKVRFVGDATSRIQEDYLRILRYFRFYGRIAKEPDAHEQETLRSMKENMHGLAGISGERIWVELKRIVVGNHAGSLVRTMMDLGMTQYLGFQEPIDPDEFDRVWQRCHDLSPQPFTVLPALMRSEDEVQNVDKRLKLSRDEKNLGFFIIKHREDEWTPTPFRHCQDLLCSTTGKDPKTKAKICELLKYLDMRDTLEQLQAWTPPKFPVSGHSLLELGIPKGPALAKALSMFRTIWQQSDYTKGEEEMLELHIDEVKEKLEKS